MEVISIPVCGIMKKNVGLERTDIMASMTVEFFKVELMNQLSKCKENFANIKKIIDEILSEIQIQDGYRSIDLAPEITPNDIVPKEVIDVFDDSQYLFGRICRKKANNAILKRDYFTLRAEEVFNSEESKKSGIEFFTFFILDYEKGILSIVNAKGAPGKRAISSLIERFRPEYCLEFIDIPNKDGIQVLYNSMAPEISRIEFDIPTPNAEFLQRVLGLEEDIIREMIQDNVMSASVLLKPTPYGKLLRKRDSVRSVLDILFWSRNNFKKTLIKGNSEKFSSRNFDLNSKFFTYPIDVKMYRIIKGKQVNYSLEEVVEQYRIGLHRAYEDNYDLIVGIANR